MPETFVTEKKTTYTQCERIDRASLTWSTVCSSLAGFLPLVRNIYLTFMYLCHSVWPKRFLPARFYTPKQAHTHQKVNSKSSPITHNLAFTNSCFPRWLPPSTCDRETKHRWWRNNRKPVEKKDVSGGWWRSSRGVTLTAPLGSSEEPEEQEEVSEFWEASGRAPAGGCNKSSLIWVRDIGFLSGKFSALLIQPTQNFCRMNKWCGPLTWLNIEFSVKILRSSLLINVSNGQFTEVSSFVKPWIKL